MNGIQNDKEDIAIEQNIWRPLEEADAKQDRFSIG